METAESSYDPRSWRRATTAEAAPPPIPPAKPKMSRRTILLAGALLVIALAAGFVFLLARSDNATAPAPRAPAEGSLPTPSAADAQPAAEGRVRRSLTLLGPEGIETALLAAGLPEDKAQAAQKALVTMLPADAEIRLSFEIADGEPPALASLNALLNDGSGAELREVGGEFKVSRITGQLKSEVQVVRGEMDTNSFYSSAVAAGVPDSLIADIAKAFAFDFDFQREIHPGDVFSAAFDQKFDSTGAPVGPPDLVYASMETAEKSRALYHFQPASGDAGWFDANGASVVQSLMRTPVDGARITSQFGMRRHPILGYAKLHRGTDFAAPTGTPVFASGNAVIEFAAPKGANGNFIRLRHDNGWQTLYLHLNRFAPGIEAGMHVRQGQLIGEVGTTGRSTGPHLHYEVHIDGQPVNPLSIKMDSEKSKLTGREMAAFLQVRNRIDKIRVAQ